METYPLSYVVLAIQVRFERVVLYLNGTRLTWIRAFREIRLNQTPR